MYLMGILNVTPDSFWDGGKYHNLDLALKRAEEMMLEGADIIDIGGESTRPGFTPVSIQEEIERIAPILQGIKERFDIPLSLDSYKPEVVEAVAPWVDLVNDIWGFKKDNRMPELVAKLGLPVCLMHNRTEHDYQEFWGDFILDLKGSIAIAKQHGIADDKIILDGGVGFQKTYQENLMVMNRTEIICELGYPVMIATSNKGTLGKIVGREKEHRLAATLATTVLGYTKGASFVRVHDIAENLDAIRMTRAMIGECDG